MTFYPRILPMGIGCYCSMSDAMFLLKIPGSLPNWVQFRHPCIRDLEVLPIASILCSTQWWLVLHYGMWQPRLYETTYSGPTCDRCRIGPILLAHVTSSIERTSPKSQASWMLWPGWPLGGIPIVCRTLTASGHLDDPNSYESSGDMIVSSASRQQTSDRVSRMPGQSSFDPEARGGLPPWETHWQGRLLPILPRAFHHGNISSRWHVGRRRLGLLRCLSFGQALWQKRRWSNWLWLEPLYVLTPYRIASPMLPIPHQHQYPHGGDGCRFFFDVVLHP